MKRFAFKLESVLRHRASVEEVERSKLAALQMRLQSDVRALESVETQLAASLEELGRRQVDGADSRDIALFQRFADRLRRRSSELRTTIDRSRSDVAKQQTVVLEAARATKVLDTLKAKQAKEHRVSAEKLEQKNVDEMVVARFAGREETPVGTVRPSETQD